VSERRWRVKQQVPGEIDCVEAAWQMLGGALGLQGVVLDERSVASVRFTLSSVYRAGFLLGDTWEKRRRVKCSREKKEVEGPTRADLLAAELLSRLSFRC